MSYGGQSNAPWQRNMMQSHQQSGGFHQGSQMYMQGAQQNSMAAFSHGGMQGGGSLFPGNGSGGGGGNSVSYPQPRSGLNPVAFQQGGGAGGGSHCNSIGTVTKMNIDCGLVNDEIFFYRNVCKGPEPKLGDRVMFEATYSNSGQFKWNATRIQLMQPALPLMNSNKNSYGSVAPPSEYQRSQIRRNSPKRSPVRGRHERDIRERDRLHRSRDKDEDEHDRKRRREDRSRDRVAAVGGRTGVIASEARGGHVARNEKERDRVEPKKKEREFPVRDREDRERERTRELERASTKGRRPRAVKRYMVQIPRGVLTIKTADIQQLRHRYHSLYIPSDFFLSNVKWSDSFTPDNPFSLRRPCQFHIMHESVESPTEQNPDILEPSDANYLYSAKVMLMSLPPIAEIYKKCFENDDDDDHHPMHPSRLINFLVGVKGRVGSMAIGGPWSPSLDGENPDEDPSVLIRTAIRTCKALTGIDLSNCTQWYRFVELYYHRTEYKNMEKDGPPRVETVVIYLPDVHSCMPSIEEWQTLTQVYKNAANGVIARRAALVAAAAANTNDDNDKSNDVEMADNAKSIDDREAGEGDKTEDENFTENLDENEQDADNGDEDQNAEEQEEQMDSEGPAVCIDLSCVTDDDNEGDAEAENEDPAVDEVMPADEENDEPAPEPTHYSLLDLKSMKVQEIRDELLARNLSDKGVRNVVMARLAKALNNEKAEENQNKKNKQQAMLQKPIAVKIGNESNNKDKKDVEKMELDNEAASKKTDETKKKNDKKAGADAADNSSVNKDVKSEKSPIAKKVKIKNEKDDKEDWADIIDFELSDIVILDEYDSSKNNEENNLKEMTEREKNQLIRFHTLPSTPHIIVHPNRQAKGGKFDCAVVSLSVLLDYHPDDSKERFFEVSLFAELFNEMLMRDFGFNIYKEMYFYKETPETSNVSEVEGDAKTGDDNKTGEEAKKESKEREDEKDKSSKKDSKPSHEEKSAKDHHNDDIQSVKSESRKRKISTSTSLANGKDREVSVSKKKMVVVKPELLLSFIYFDASYCGYIFDKHLEDLFYVLGLNLSRSQIKSVLAKLGTSTVSPQPIYYRKLTEREESLEATPVIEDINDLPIEEQQRIAAGNNYYENVFGKTTVRNQISAIPNDGNEGLINFNGTVVDVGKLLNQIKRSEKSYSDLEKVHNDLLKQHSDLQKEHTKSTSKVKDLQSEIKSVSRKLTDANQDFYSLNRKYRDQNATLSYIYTRVAPYFAREKDKEKDAKLEGSREKDKNDKEKEKDKSKDKDCEKEKDKTKDGKEIKSEESKSKDDVEMEDVADDKEKIVVKDEKDKEKNKIKDENEKTQEKVKDEKEKDKLKDEKDKVKDEKENLKDDKEKVKDVKEKEKPKDDKQKQIVKDDKAKPATPKVVTEKQKTVTPAPKKIADSKTPAKFVRKNDGTITKK